MVDLIKQTMPAFSATAITLLTNSKTQKLAIMELGVNIGNIWFRVSWPSSEIYS